MDFYKLCQLVGELAQDKGLSVSVTARRGENGEWTVRFGADAISFYGTGVSAPSPEGLLMKLRAEKIQGVKPEDVGLISKVSEA